MRQHNLIFKYNLADYDQIILTCTIVYIGLLIHVDLTELSVILYVKGSAMFAAIYSYCCILYV